MKAQLIRLLLAMCLITSTVICPGLVFWKIWQDHIEVVNTQRIAHAGDRAVFHPVIVPTRHYPEFFPTHFNQPLVKPPASLIIMTAGLSFIISVVLGFCSGQWLHHRYQAHRNTTMRQQVSQLEKIWQQSIH